MEFEIGQQVKFTRPGKTIRGTILQFFSDDKDGTRKAFVKILYKFNVTVPVDELSDDSGTDHRAAYIESLEETRWYE